MQLERSSSSGKLETKLEYKDYDQTVQEKKILYDLITPTNKIIEQDEDTPDGEHSKDNKDNV